jgi:hypothetical protein
MKKINISKPIFQPRSTSAYMLLLIAEEKFSERAGNVQQRTTVSTVVELVVP